jgi:trans-aconitate 2-methyltransferase
MSIATSTAAPRASGSVQWDADDYQRHSSVQAGWGREVHERLALRGDEHVVDLGCGDGRLTSELAARLPRGSVTGLDADADMIEFAERHYGGKNVSFVKADACRFSLGRRVDLFVSTACLHWVEAHDEVLRCCRAHLEHGGRLFFQMGGRGNCAELLSAAETTAREARWAPFLLPFTNPWYFRGPEDYEALLPRSCFRPLRAEIVHKEMVHESRDGLRAWLRTTWMPVLSRVPEALRSELVDAIVDRYLAVHPPDARRRTHAAMVRFELEAEAI